MMQWSQIAATSAGEDYNYLHWVVDSTRIEVFAVLPRIRALEDSHGLTGDPITASRNRAR